MNATLGRITIFPIKSLDGVDLQSVAVLPSGALENDRRFALVDSDGHYVNGKRTAAVHGVRATYDLASLIVRFNDTAEFSLEHQQREIGAWLTEALGIACGLAENPTSGFPDDTDSPGPTLLSTATLESVAGWFPNLTVAEARRRFRANLEIDRFESAEAVEPFWEDRLIGPPGTAIPFRIGAIDWWGNNPCQRCVVPTRDSATGDVTPGFQKSFAIAREMHLPQWAPPERFNHFYRLAVNTQLASGQSSARLHVGDAVALV
jgi:MOSC domain-containing protein